MIKIFQITVVCSIIGLATMLTVWPSELEADTFTIVQTKRMPASVPINTNAIATYTVTNNSDVTLEGNEVVGLPNSYLKDMGGVGDCNFPATLKPHETCKLNLLLNAPKVISPFSSEITVCNARVYCTNSRPPYYTTTVVN